MKPNKPKAQDKFATFWAEAKKHVKLRSDDLENPEWFEFGWDEPARAVWESYFGWRFGKQPAGMRYLRSGRINTMLVPDENPAEFDPQWRGHGKAGGNS